MSVTQRSKQIARRTFNEFVIVLNDKNVINKLYLLIMFPEVLEYVTQHGLPYHDQR